MARHSDFIQYIFDQCSGTGNLTVLKRFFLFFTVLCMVSCTTFEHLGQNVEAGWTTLMRKLGLTTSPTALVNLSELEMARIGPETESVDGIYFSDFVEKDNSNHIRPAVRFRHTSDTLLGDKMMPLSAFSRFYGIENGRIKAGRLDQFEDSTTVLPVRNRDFGYISRIELNRDPSSSGWLYVRNPFTVLKERRMMRREMQELVKEDTADPECLSSAWLREQIPIVTWYPPSTSVTVFGAKGSVIYEPTIHDAHDGKVFLADSTGNAAFINNLPGFDAKMLQQLNALLSEHPMGPVLIDNGRYYKFSLSSGDYSNYVRQDLHRHDSCLFVVGSLKQVTSD